MIKGLTKEQETLVIEIFKSFSGTAIAFGSRVTGKPRPDSDLDICLKGLQGKVPLLEISNLRERFENSSLPFKVDLVDYADMDIPFKLAADSGVEIRGCRTTSS